MSELLRFFLVIFLVFFALRPSSAQKVTAEDLKNKGNELLRDGNYAEAIEAYREGVKIVDESQPPELAGILHNNMGVALYNKGEILKGIEAYEKALELYHLTGNDTLIAEANLNLGIVYKYWNAYEQSMKHLLFAARELEKLGVEHSLASAYNALGNLHIDLNEPDKALKYLNDALEIRKRSDNIYDIAGSFNALSRHYQELEDYKQALYYQHKSSHLKEQLNKPLYKATSFTRLGELYTQANQVDSAMYFIRKALEIRESAKHTPGVSASCHDLGKLLLTIGKIDSAMVYLNRAYALADSLHNHQLLLESGTDLRNVLLRTGNFERANTLASRLLAIKDTLGQQDRLKRATEMEVKYSVEKKEKELGIQRLEIDILSEKNKLYIVIAGILFLLFALALVSWLFLRRKNHQIKKQRDRNEALHREIQHRVKNNLTLLGGIMAIQSNEAADDKLKGLINENKRRVEAIALMHSYLDRSQDKAIADIRLSDLIVELVRNTMISFGFNENKIQLTIDTDDIDCDFSKSIYIALMVNEVITNAFKYAFIENESPALYVSLKHLNHAIQLVVKDNGKGFAESGESGTGQNLIKMMASQIKAKTTFESSSEGVEFRLIAKK